MHCEPFEVPTVEIDGPPLALAEIIADGMPSACAKNGIASIKAIADERDHAKPDFKSPIGIPLPVCHLGSPVPRPANSSLDIFEFSNFGPGLSCEK